MKWKYVIKDITLAGGVVNIEYTMFGRLITGRVSIPIEEFTPEKIRKEIEGDIALRKEQIMLIQEIVVDWKTKEFEVDVGDKN